MTKKAKNKPDTNDIAQALRKQQIKEGDGVVKLTVRPQIDYDEGELNKFLDGVFHALEDDENILCWKTPDTKAPSFPVSRENAIDKLGRSHKAQKLYFGTATCLPDKEDKLRNRKDLFDRLHVVVLDDIGTKVNAEDLPEDLEPTYIIETSEGNFQYGYVLKDPIEELAQAELLIQLVYESGYSDGGGKMPNKLVRLPAGINGKQGEKGDFKCRLTLWEPDNLWTPDELLEVLDLGVTWKEVEADAEKVAKERAVKSAGATPWASTKSYCPDLSGVTDAVLEYFYSKNMVVNETDAWIDIKCPWHSLHTSGGNTAGYSALGRGGMEHHASRGFHCFHDACKDRKITDLLAYVAANGGPEAPIRDLAAKLVSQWVYDSSTDKAFKVVNVKQPRGITMNAFKNTYPRKSLVPTYDGKTVAVPDHALWLHSPSRVIVAGRCFDPTTTAKIVKHDDDLLLNLFTHPEWGRGEYDDKDIEMFTGFLEYLIPEDNDREYFLDWLAAKTHDMRFRGAAILMIAKAQGTGRSTLADMICTLLGAENTANVPFSDLTGEATFNEWMEKPLIYTNETKDINDGHSYFKAYERLKELVDPRATRKTINEKYGGKRETDIYSSYLMFSNHENAVAIASSDRRFYIMKNVNTPATPAFFTRLNEWLDIKDSDGRPKWAKSVWRWLAEREVDMERMLAPVPNTQAKREMIHSTKQPVTVVVEAIIEAMGDFVAGYQVNMYLDKYTNNRLDLDALKNKTAQINNSIKAVTLPTHDKTLLRILQTNGTRKSVRPRIKIEAAGKEGYTKRFISSPISKADKGRARIAIESVNEADIAEAIDAALASCDL